MTENDDRLRWTQTRKLLKGMKRPQIEVWLTEQDDALEKDMRRRLNIMSKNMKRPGKKCQ